jgi:hypothetical protein
MLCIHGVTNLLDSALCTSTCIAISAVKRGKCPFVKISVPRNLGECGLAASLGSLQGTDSFLKHFEPKSVLQLAPLIWDLLSGNFQ